MLRHRFHRLALTALIFPLGALDEFSVVGGWVADFAADPVLRRPVVMAMTKAAAMAGQNFDIRAPLALTMRTTAYVHPCLRARRGPSWGSGGVVTGPRGRFAAVSSGNRERA